MSGGPLAFLLPGAEPLLRPPRIGAETGAIAFDRFANGELHVRLGMPVQRRECVVVGSVAPPEHRLVELLLAVDTLKRHGATRVHVVLPYLGYSRQDRLEPGESVAIAWVGGMLRASGAAGVVTVDAHSDAALRLLDCPVRSASPAPVLAAALRDAGVGPDTVVVAPDPGAKDRAQAVASELGVPAAWTEKRRTPAGVRTGAIHGPLRAGAVVVDDILDTGATLAGCCHELRDRGVTTIDLAVTHGLFSGERWRELLEMARSIHVTDSTEEARAEASGRVHVHPLARLLEETVRDRIEGPAHGLMPTGAPGSFTG